MRQALGTTWIGNWKTAQGAPEALCSIHGVHCSGPPPRRTSCKSSWHNLQPLQLRSCTALSPLGLSRMMTEPSRTLSHYLHCFCLWQLCLEPPHWSGWAFLRPTLLCGALPCPSLFMGVRPASWFCRLFLPSSASSFILHRGFHK